MKSLRLTSIFALAALACSGGGGDGGGTTAPTAPPTGGNRVLGSITTNVSTLGLGAGATGTITVTAYDDQSKVLPSATPTFTSANPVVAEVNSAGEVLALSAGSTQITAAVTMGAVSRTAPVTVTVTGVLPSEIDVVASSVDYVFTPDVVAIQLGGTVTWTFGGLAHTVTFAGTSGAPPDVISGYFGTASRSFGSAGTFNYICTIHAGMSGQVIVR